MPKKHIAGPFVIDPDFDELADINKNVKEIREKLARMLESISQLPDDMLQAVCMFSVIDCFAQEWAGYPSHGNAKTFCNFVIRFQDQYDYMEKIDPVSLYYRVENIIEKKPPSPGMEPELVISIEDYGGFGSFTKELDSQFCKDVLVYIRQNCDEKQYNKLVDEHSIVRLLYQMRNKTTHELSNLGAENRWDKEENHTEPYYRDMGRIYVSEGNVVSDDVYELVFPIPFIQSIANNCISNYLDYCVKEHRYPFSHKWPNRNMTLCWYDTILHEDGTIK